MRNKRTLNLPFLAGLLISPFVIAGLVHLLHHFQMIRNASSYLRQARRALEEDGQNSKSTALSYLARYVQLAPNDPEGLILLGLQYADVNSFQRAAIMLERGLTFRPDRADVRRRLVECLMRLGRFTDASDHLQNFLLKDAPNDGELLQQLGECQRSKQEFEQAAKTFQASIQSSPDRLEPYAMLASLQQDRLNLVKEAFATINQMVSVNPDNPRAYLFRGEWFLHQYRDFKTLIANNRMMDRSGAEKFLEDAESDSREFLERDPENADGLMFAARLKLITGKRDDLRQYLFKGIELHPNRTDFYTMLSNLESDSGNPALAIEAMRKGVLAAPKNPELQWNLARLLIESDNTSEATEIIAKLRTEKYPAVALDFLEARMLYRRSEWLPMIQKIESKRGLISPTADTAFLFKRSEYMLGVAYREINSTEPQIASFRRALAIDPDWIQAKLALADSLAAADQGQEAASAYAEICSTPNPPLSAMFGLAKSWILFNRNRIRSNQDWREFDAVIAKLAKLDPQPVQVAILQTQKLSVSSEQDEAARFIRNAREKNPQTFELWFTEFELAESRRDSDLATELVEKVQEQFGDSVNVRLMRGRSIILKSESSDEVKAELLKLSEPDASWSEPQRLQLAEIFASLFVSIDDYDNAERLALIVQKAQPKNLRIRSFLLEVGRRSKRLNQMENALQEMKAVEGEGADWQYGQAQRLILVAQETKDVNAYREALAHLDKAKVLRPTDAQYPSLSGRILDNLGDQPAALSQFLEAIRLGEKSPVVTTRALTLLASSRKIEEADKLISELREKRAPFTEEMSRIAVSVALQLGHKDVAAKTLEQLVRDFQGGSDPKWLARAYFALEKYQLAEEQYRSAMVANPGEPDLWVGLVQTLARSKQPEKAEAAIEEAKLAISEDKVALTVGQCYEIMGKASLADEFYRKAIITSPDNPLLRRKQIEFQLGSGNLREAEVSLRKMGEQLNENDEGAQNLRSWVDRNLAICLLAMGSPLQLTEALKIVDQMIQKNGVASNDDLRLKASILAKWPARSERQQAIPIFEKLAADDKTVTAEDRWQLANLYQLEGDLKRSRAELLKAIFLRKDDPRFYVRYIGLSLKADELSNAELYIEALQKLLPNDWLTIDLQSQVLYARKKYPEIVSLLKKFVTSPAGIKEKPEAAQFRKYLIARQFESFANKLTRDEQPAVASRFVSEAESLFNQIVKDNPDEIMVLIDFLAGTKQIDRAMELLQEHGSKSGVGGIINVVRKITKNPAVSPEQLRRLQDQVTQFQALVEDKKLNDPPMSILLTLADLMGWRGEIKESQRIYQDVLRKRPDNIYALNNLAVLLALNSGDHRAAMKLVTSAINNGGPMDSLHDTRGLVSLAAGQSGAAVVDFKSSIFEKESAENQFHLAVAYSRIGAIKDAKESLAIAEKLGLFEEDLHPKERIMLKTLRKLLATEGAN
ncbi:MAG: tetratricopeptide repeat protein [Schlesneria sp.]